MPRLIHSKHRIYNIYSSAQWGFFFFQQKQIAIMEDKKDIYIGILIQINCLNSIICCKFFYHFIYRLKKYKK